jgi:hypothetical protein
MAAVRALQTSRAFSRVVLPVHSRTFSRIAVRAPQSLALVSPSSVRAFSATTRVQDGKYTPFVFQESFVLHYRVFKFLLPLERRLTQFFPSI